VTSGIFHGIQVESIAYLLHLLCVEEFKLRSNLGSFMWYILAKYLGVKSSGCDSDNSQQCNYFCVTCLLQARRNPLECPSHGPAESPIGKYMVNITAAAV